MTRTRETFHDELVKILSEIDPIYEEGHCFFRRPSKKLEYPCILYDVSKKDSKHADNLKYLNYTRYTITVVDFDPDSQISEKINEMNFSSFDRCYQSDGLNHFVYTVYY